MACFVAIKALVYLVYLMCCPAAAARPHVCSVVKLAHDMFVMKKMSLNMSSSARKHIGMV
jgi:hypothetical protein